MNFKNDYYDIFPQLSQLESIYKKIDEAINRVKEIYNIRCPKGCGTCCESALSNIEASIVEMLPLCIYSYEKNIYSDVLLQIHHNRCPFFNNNASQNEGCCSAYPYRPLICRLFGFSFMKNKYGTLVPVTCSTLRKEYENKIEITTRHSQLLPLMHAYSLQSITIDLAIGTPRYPMNIAFEKAMDYVLLKFEAYYKSRCA